jgi:hypothetical protein
MITQPTADAICEWSKGKLMWQSNRQFVDFINSLVSEDEHCSDHVPMICAFLNCDCEDCNKGKTEIAKRMYKEWQDDCYKRKDHMLDFPHWLDQQEE